MPNNLSSIEEQTSELVEATVKLLWAHRDDVANGKVASDSARVYLALVKGACEALPASEKDLARLSAVCEATNVAITAAADREEQGKLGLARQGLAKIDSRVQVNA
ncbi:hypothetical protein SAMN05216466_102415 [Paraburkholderia phenazinium]|uniref:Uncharacterized protein n=2 Tax=Paraburkholderia phenazinium TaxID=60549 RepID=A0A1G7S7S6_9BURK|nr:hypothetical protein [Paraburkholderia phenazinium]SDG18994.1 hypothetical protein SAMN05216466_102415 [Paraburkholderia phenazinium]